MGYWPHAQPGTTLAAASGMTGRTGALTRWLVRSAPVVRIEP